jgi:uncharacterized protein involved in exopolysaccharide biosynthesis
MEGTNSANHNGHHAPAFSRSLRDLVGVGFRRRELIVRCFLGVLAGALLAMLILPATYEAQMKILVDRERVDPVVSTEANVLQQDRGLTADEVVSEVELFQSRDSLEKAVIDCGLSEPKSPWSLAAIKLRVLGILGLAPDKKTRVFQSVLKLEKDLQVIPVNSSNLIKVTYDSHSPELAAQVLKELGDLYLAKHAQVHRPAGTSDFFEQQADKYKKQLADAEMRLVNFSHETGDVSPEFEKQALMQKVGDFNIALEQTRSEVAETKHRLRALRAQEASVPSRVTTQVKVADNGQLMANLKSTLLNLELKRTELLEKYQPGYPLLQEVEKEVAETIAAIADAEQKGIHEETTDQDPTHVWVRTEMAKATADLVGFEARVQAMSGALHQMQTKALKLNQEAAVQQDLLRTAKADEESYLLYHRKREEARIADALDRRRIVNAAVAEAATVPMAPIGLPALLKLMLAVLTAALVALGVGFIAEYLDPSFRTTGEVEQELEIPLLASIPKNGH